jgi:hypothetical protein
MFRIVGKIKNKKYVSTKHYRTQKSALKAAYDKVYMKNGNTRRKNQLHDFYIEKV